MNNKTTSHAKRIPQRTCVGCRLVQPKRTLIRIVASPQGVIIDPTGKAPGRGAYLHNSLSCWKKGLDGKLEQALKVELSREERSLLSAFQETLPDDVVTEKGAEAA